ncbi:hypothetical protein [Streptomyces sp. NPDC059176]|uniref:hypothetical protein n=1 Tax=unclassified Streptomyces TaxID=2593676 RepID=UPI0036CD6A3E
MTARRRTTDDRAPAEEVRRTAREEGLAPAVTALAAHLTGDILAPGPYGHAVLPEDGFTGGRDQEVLGRWELPGGAVLLVHGARRGPGAGAVDQRLLLALRLGLVEGLRDACTARLASRPSGDGTVLMQQMVKGQVAEGLAHQLELAAVLASLDDDAPDASQVRHLHREVTAAGRAVLRLFGAHGFLADGPGAVAHVSELLADVHLPAEETA